MPHGAGGPSPCGPVKLGDPARQLEVIAIAARVGHSAEMIDGKVGRGVRLLVGSVALAAGLTACGGGGSSTSSDPKLAAVCKDNLDINEGFATLFSTSDGPPGNGPPSAAAVAHIKADFPRLVGAPLDDVNKNAPDAIKSDIAAVSVDLHKFGATGDGSVFDSPDFKARSLKIDNYFYDHCDGPKQAATAADYKFSGLPDKLPAGVVQFKLTNSGKEEHEMLVLRRKSGVTDSFDQILALPREQTRTKTEAVTEVSASPGKTDATVGRLTPGQYVIICSISKGTIGDKQGDGPPHFTLGMKKEFTVA